MIQACNIEVLYNIEWDYILSVSLLTFHVFVASSIVRQTESSTAVATEAASSPPSPPPLSDANKPVDPKIDKIVNDITSLNLIEVAELSDLLKKRLNLPDAPVMPVGGFIAASQAVIVIIFYGI